MARLESGLTLYTSVFESPDGSTGVISGPHPEFTKTGRTAHFACDKIYSYYTPSVHRYVDFLSLIGEIPLLGQKDSHVDSDLVQLFPETSCIEKQVISATSEQSSLPREFDRCEFGDPVAGASRLEFIVSNKVYLSRRGPKCLKFFEELDKTGTNFL